MCFCSVVKLHHFVAFLIAAIVAAMLLGRPVASITTSLNHGIGDMLGSLTAILCLGAMFGRIVADSGAARRIAGTLIGVAGTKRITTALAMSGFLVGIPLFYNVGFVLKGLGLPSIDSLPFFAKNITANTLKSLLMEWIRIQIDGDSTTGSSMLAKPTLRR